MATGLIQHITNGQLIKITTFIVIEAATDWALALAGSMAQTPSAAAEIAHARPVSARQKQSAGYINSIGVIGRYVCCDALSAARGVIGAQLSRTVPGF